jgi:hypothetical protein
VARGAGVLGVLTGYVHQNRQPGATVQLCQRAHRALGARALVHQPEQHGNHQRVAPSQRQFSGLLHHGRVGSRHARRERRGAPLGVHLQQGGQGLARNRGVTRLQSLLDHVGARSGAQRLEGTERGALHTGVAGVDQRCVDRSSRSWICDRSQRFQHRDAIGGLPLTGERLQQARGGLVRACLAQRPRDLRTPLGGIAQRPQQRRQRDQACPAERLAGELGAPTGAELLHQQGRGARGAGLGDGRDGQQEAL